MVLPAGPGRLRRFGDGALSGRLERFDQATRDHIRSALHDLPEDIGLLHARVVVPVMFALRVQQSLNVLAAEALAVAVLVEARLLVTTDSPHLRSGAADLGIGYEVLA